MKILVIGDTPKWAIGHLARIYIDGNPQFNFRELYVHPKEVAEGVPNVRDNMDWADIIIFEYWNTAKQLIEFIPELEEKKLMLMHHNQKNLTEFDQSAFSMLLCHTKKAQMILKLAQYKNVEIIPYGFDFNYWKYNDAYPPTEGDGEVKAVGYAGRIVPWKNLKEIAAACYELQVPLMFMGKMDKLSYWDSIPQEHRDNIDMSFMDCPDEERIEFYKKLSIFVNFSSDGREEGTMPFMEAMAAGVPVVTTRSGTAADIIVHRKNGIIVPFDDAITLKDEISHLLDDPEMRQTIRKEAWNTIRNMTTTRMARRYSTAFHRVYSDQPLVSVVIPVHDTKNLEAMLLRMNEMTWPHTEVVICDDSGHDVNIPDTPIEVMVNDLRKKLDVPIKYVKTGNPGYGLAEARNRGIIEAEGEYIMFCDSRMMPERDAIDKFIEVLKPQKKAWIFGDKGAQKMTFVENFSFVRRQDIIDLGMFNERIDRYGGMSQELRKRCERQGFKTGYVPDAKAEQLSGSHSSPERRDSIIAMKDLLWKIGYND